MPKKIFPDREYEKAKAFAEKVNGNLYLNIFKGQPITVEWGVKKKYKAIVYFEDMYNKQHKRTIVITAKKGERAQDVYNRLKSENGVIEIHDFGEIK